MPRQATASRKLGSHVIRPNVYSRGTTGWPKSSGSRPSRKMSGSVAIQQRLSDRPPFSGLAPPCQLSGISSPSRRGTASGNTGSSVRIEAPGHHLIRRFGPAGTILGCGLQGSARPRRPWPSKATPADEGRPSLNSPFFFGKLPFSFGKLRFFRRGERGQRWTTTLKQTFLLK